MSAFQSLRRTEIDGRTMAWRRSGEGLPVVLVHGNPTSSYLWRNVVPHLEDRCTCYAPDLIGMGGSDKLPDKGPRTYSYFVHRQFFDGWMASLDISEPILFVGQNWGVPLMCDWAMRNPDRTRGLVHMEGQVAPMSTEAGGERFKAFNAHMHSAEMEADVLNNNLYLNQYFFRYLEDVLTDEDRAVYETPYAEPGPGRRPTIDWPCEIPVDGEPADVHDRLLDLVDWMSGNDIPKLWLIPDTGSVMTGERKTAAESFANQQTLTIEGGHYTPETSPDAIGRAITAWLETID